MKQKKPTWLTVSAVVMLLFGGCGAKNDFQFIYIDSMLAMKDKIFAMEENKNEDSTEHAEKKIIPQDSIQKDSLAKALVHPKENPAQKDSTVEDNSIGDTIRHKSEDEKDLDMVKSFLDFSDAQVQRIIQIGYVGLFFSLLYFVGGLILIFKSKFNASIFYGIVVCNLIFSLVRWYLLSGINSIVSVTTGVMSVFSVLGAVILLILAIANKSSVEDDIFVD